MLADLPREIIVAILYSAENIPATYFAMICTCRAIRRALTLEYDGGYLAAMKTAQKLMFLEFAAIIRSDANWHACNEILVHNLLVFGGPQMKGLILKKFNMIDYLMHSRDESDMEYLMVGVIGFAQSLFREHSIMSQFCFIRHGSPSIYFRYLIYATNTKYAQKYIHVLSGEIFAGPRFYLAEMLIAEIAFRIEYRNRLFFELNCEVIKTIIAELDIKKDHIRAMTGNNEHEIAASNFLINLIGD